MFLKRKFFTLSDIKKHLVYTPLIFVFITAIVSIVVIIFILEVKKNNDLNLYKQKETFYKQTTLNQYVDDLKYQANANFDTEELVLNEKISEIIGVLKHSKQKITLKKLKNIFNEVSKQSKLDFVLFDKKQYKIFYGEKSIDYLKVIIDANIGVDNFRFHILRNIAYIGHDNLIYWIDKNKRKIRLSYFKEVEGTNWYLGAFSKIDDMKDSMKDAILDSIVTKSKSDNNSYFWFYDYDLGYVYNYYNKGQKTDAKYILEKDRLNSSNAILKKYKENKDGQTSSDIYNFMKYNFLVAIKSNNYSKQLAFVEYEYNTKLSISIAIVFIFAMFLIIASILFSKFINSIFHRYNKRLETRNSMYKKWKDRYELAIIASNDGLWDIDLKTNHIYFSKKWLDMFGYKDGDINNLDEWLALIHPEDKYMVENNLQQHLDGKSNNFVCEYRIKDKSNKYKWILVRGKAFKDTNHKRMLMMSMDIEQRKKLTKELQYVDLLVEYGRIVIFKWKNDSNMSIDYISKSISSYGYDASEFESGKVKYFDFVHKDDLKSYLEELQEALKRDDRSFTKVYRVKDRDGDIRWIFNRTIFLKDDFGKTTHFYGYISDITQLKLNEEELKKKIADEVAKNTEKDRILVHQSKLAAMGEMLGNIAHQWRQPLNNINLLTHFVRDNYGNLSKDQLDDIVKDTKLQIDYMSQTIDDFRNFYQPNKDRLKFDIKDAIKQSTKIVDTQFEKNGIKLNINGCNVEIINYMNEFQQVVLNILNNASDAALVKMETEDFDPSVDIVIEKLDDKYVKINIANNCGEVSKDIIDRIFEPYFTTKFENQGTGIGLYMAKTIIEKNMGGKISVSNIKDGVIFTIILPL